MSDSSHSTEPAALPAASPSAPPPASPDAEPSGAPPPSYDLFLVHAPGDERFVRGFLLDGLGLPEARVRVVGGDPPSPAALPELERAVEQSRIFVVVVTPAFLAHPWAQLAEQWATHTATSAERAVIPLLLEPCQLPLHLRSNVALDLRDPIEWTEGLGRLRQIFDQPPPLEPVLPCPYPGMRPFKAEDAAHFHGRDREIGELVAHVRAGKRELLLVGPSGSGKSSLVFAGLLPRLARDVELAAEAPDRAHAAPRFVVRTLRPGERPMLRLAFVLGGTADFAAAAPTITAVSSLVAAQLATTPGAERLLLVVDQLEELFIQAPLAEQHRFAAAISLLRNEPRCVLLLTLRADFFAELMQHRMWREGGVTHVDVSPLRGEGLRAAIEQPAHDARVYLEPALVERLLADADSPGALPLMQETLVQLWERRRRRFLPLAAYEELGRALDTAPPNEATPNDAAFGAGDSGAFPATQAATDAATDATTGTAQDPTLAVPADETPRSGLAVAISRRADRCLAELSPAKRRIARRIFLRLISFGEGRPDTRRQLPVAVLGRGEDPDDFAATLVALTDARLLILDAAAARSVDADRVDLAHEALITAWPSLTAWVRVRRADEERRRQLEERADQWVRRGRGRGGLLDAEELPLARAWRRSEAASELGASPELTSLLDASEHHFSRQRRRRLLTLAIVFSVLAAFTLIATALALYARSQAGEANAQRATAERRRLDTERLLGRSYRDTGRQLLLDGRPRDAVAYLVAARERGLDSRDLRVLFHLATANPLLATLPHDQITRARDLSRDGKLLVTGAGQIVRLWDTTTGTLRFAWPQADRIADVWLREAQGLLQVMTKAGLVTTWDLTTSAPRSAPRQLPVTESFGWTAAASASGRWLADPSYNDGFVLLDPFEANAPRHVFRHPASIRTFDFSPDESLMVTVDSKDEAWLWDVATSTPLWRIGAPYDALLGPPEPATSFDRAIFSTDGEHLITVEHDHTMKVWNVKEKAREQGPIAEHHNRGIGAAGSRYLFATFGQDNTLRVWHRSGHEAGEPLRHQSTVASFAFGNDPDRVATASLDTTAQLWSVSSGLRLSVPLQHPDGVSGLFFAPDDQRLFTIAGDGDVRIWDVRSPVLRSFGEDVSGTAPLTISADWSRLFTIDDTAQIWDIATGKLISTLVDPEIAPRDVPDISAAVFTPDGTRLVTGDTNGAARIWDVATGRPVAGPAGAPLQHTLSRDGSLVSVFGLAVSRDGTLLVTLGQDGKFLTPAHRGTARVWDLRTGQPITPFLDDYDSKNLSSAELSADNRTLLTAGESEAARLWSLPSGELLAKLPHAGKLESARFSPDGRTVLTAGQDRYARLWDATTGAPLRSFGSAEQLIGARFDSAGTRIVTYGFGNIVKVWSVATGQLASPTLPHSNAVLDAIFTRDGSFLATNSSDGEVRLWDVATGALLHALESENVRIHSIALSPDGDQLLTANGGEPTQLWDITADPGTLEEWRARLQRGAYPIPLALERQAR